MPCNIDVHMQFNSGGLEALLEANGVAMEPSGAILLTGQQLCPVTLLVTASYCQSLHKTMDIWHTPFRQ